jgi:hypothetical protein
MGRFVVCWQAQRTGMAELTPEKARIFRITHIANVPWILANGLHCNSAEVHDPAFISIGNAELIAKRTTRLLPQPCSGTLDDWIPFYFTPHSPMLYNIKTGWQGIQKRPMKEIVVLVSTLPALASKGVRFAFSDRHAYLQLARFSDNLKDLAEWIDWKILQAKDFKRDPNDPGKFERYQAEALVHKHLPVSALTGIVCYGVAEEASLAAAVQAAGLDLPIAARSDWFF